VSQKKIVIPILFQKKFVLLQNEDVKRISNMYDLIRQDILFIMLYAIVTVIAALACVYLLFRRGNAFAPDVIPPRRLRR
jgi:hypothetical protein